MNDRQARNYIQQISKRGSVYGLDQIRNLMERLGNVQEKLSIIHVAGTNGKGSVCAMTASILKESGYRTGVYSSPAVFSEEEIISVDGEPISSQEFAELITKVRKACLDLQSEGLAHPTAFEIETAAAFCYFYRRNCDFVVLETGLGGELDATNFITHPLCSVLTSISMDHMAVLGNTLAEIAKAKAGIMKAGCPCVSAVQKPEAAAVIKKKAELSGCRLYIAEPDRLADFSYDEKGSYFKVLSEQQLQNIFVNDKQGECPKPMPGHQKTDFETELSGKTFYCALAGEFQRQNIACVLSVMKALREKGIQITAEAVRAGLAKVQLHGRFERIYEQPEFYIDGAHNEDAVAFLQNTIQNRFTNRYIVYIIGVLADKDYEKALQPILPYAAQIYTITPPNDRALDGAVLAEWAGRCHQKVSFVPDIAHAVSLAAETAGAEGIVLAFGSFSFLKDIRQAVIEVYDRTDG